MDNGSSNPSSYDRILRVHRGLRARAPRSQASIVSEYLSLIPSTALPFEGRVGTISFRHWLMQTQEWMDAISMPESVRARAAAMCLTGEALEFWVTVPNNPGADSWNHFKQVMAQHFAQADALTIWRRDARYFKQNDGELIRDYSDRFQERIVERCPHLMTDWEMRDIYIRGLLPVSIPPEVPNFTNYNFAEVKLLAGLYCNFRHVAYIPTAPPTPVATPVPEDLEPLHTPEAAQTHAPMSPLTSALHHQFAHDVKEAMETGQLFALDSAVPTVAGSNDGHPEGM